MLLQPRVRNPQVGQRARLPPGLARRRVCGRSARASSITLGRRRRALHVCVWAAIAVAVGGSSLFGRAGHGGGRGGDGCLAAGRGFLRLRLQVVGKACALPALGLALSWWSPCPACVISCQAWGEEGASEGAREDMSKWTKQRTGTLVAPSKLNKGCNPSSSNAVGPRHSKQGALTRAGWCEGAQVEM